jgi:feruloyl esterase
MAAKNVLKCLALLAILTFTALPVLAAPCESLMSTKLPETTITSAQTVAAGTFRPPAAGGSALAGQPAFTQFATLPEFCRVSATLTPSSDSAISIEVWMPASNWNGKFVAVGNGGFAGLISYGALASALKAGYATASTDTGHAGNSGTFALGHPEKIVDFAYRAVHEMTVQAKAVINAYYATAPTLSFWNGCSLGGRQGITEAAKYPNDFNAIVAGAAAINQMHLMVGRLAANVFVHRSDDSYIPPSKYTLLHDAALRACDAADGVKDGVVDSPTRCRFDPKVLVCKGADAPNCLTPAQVETARTLYEAVKNPGTREDVLPRLLLPGSEPGWAILAGPEPLRYAVETFQNIVFRDASWDWHRFNGAKDIDYALKADNGVLDFTDSNLKPFFDLGGKLLMYHGWADPQVTPMGSVNYFNDVTKKLGAGVAGKSIQLYMVPGMNHCRGGAGTDTFDAMAAIEQWVAKGTAPDTIPAAHLTNETVDRTRPLCPYPQVAIYKGTGSTDLAANFVCKTR